MAESTELVNPDGPPGGGSTWSNDQKSEKPEGVPNKFWNEEKGEVDSASLLASYVELEKKMGSNPSEEAESSTSPSEISPSPDDTFNIGRYEDEYRTNENALKEETYTELQSKFGLEKSEVDKYIQYRQSESDEFAQEIYGMAGGEESYRSLLGWASNNLSKAEVDRLNTTLTTGEKDLVRVEVLKLNNKYQETVGGDAPSPIGGSTSTNKTGPKGFASVQEAVEARKDKRFELDPGYRQEWEQRVGSSSFVSNSSA